MIATASALRLPFADGTVDAALCSPPYWGGLRVYDGPQVRPWPAISYSPMPGLPPVDVPAQAIPLGHEGDPFAFVGHLLQVFREVRRVLVPGACLAVNLGDTYSGSRCGPQGSTGQRAERWFTRERSTTLRADALAAKNLTLIPWRLALAMQADGWILRSRMPGGAEVLPGLDVGIEPDIVWRKPSCMPESVRDRPTVDFEDVLLFSQGPRYFFDQEAGREVALQPLGLPEKTGQARAERLGHAQGKNATLGTNQGAAGRNMRSSWTMSPEPTDEEHFAAWPVALAARLIRVLTSERGRCTCGAPWVRQVEHRAIFDRPKSRPGRGEQPSLNAGPGQPQQGSRRVATTTTGWAPTCACYDDLYREQPRSRKAKRRRAQDATGSWWERVKRRAGQTFADGRWIDWRADPCVVLDPFAGIGRTWEAARETGRRFVGTDLGLGYCRLARSRNDLAAAARRREAERAKVRTITGPLFEGVGGET